MLLFVAALAVGLAAVTFGRGTSVPTRSAPTRPTELGRASAVDRAVEVVVRAGAAGARSDAALGSLERDVFASSASRGFKELTLTAARQQRRALLAATAPAAALLERTVPVGYQLTGFGEGRASVAVWTVQLAGPDAGKRAPAAWWLTTRVDLLAERGVWRVKAAVAVQGPTPRLVRAQQAGLGTTSELRGLLRTSRSPRHAP